MSTSQVTESQQEIPSKEIFTINGRRWFRATQWAGFPVACQVPSSSSPVRGSGVGGGVSTSEIWIDLA